MFAASKGMPNKGNVTGADGKQNGLTDGVQKIHTPSPGRVIRVMTYALL
jgi:hypothetical protein